MKREIRFRAWARGEGKMIPWESGVDNYTCEDLNNDDYFFMQYTGLLDKNGEEIYEGDIVAIKKWIGNPPDPEYAEAGIYTIDWSGDNAGFKFYPRLNDIHDVYDPNDENEYIVIGNTYENPELIK